MKIAVVGPMQPVYTGRIDFDEASGYVIFNVVNAQTNAIVGTLARIKSSSGGNKVSGDYPGLNPDVFTVDSSGHLIPA